MSRDLTVSVIDDLYKTNSQNIDLILLRASYGDDTLYFVRNYVNITYDGNEYNAIQFNLTLPDDNDVNSGSAELRIADTQGGIFEIVRSYDELTAEFEVISATDAGVYTSVSNFPNFTLTSANWDQKEVTFSLTWEDIYARTFPKDNMDNTILAGLY